jgi:hypothetical protein
MLLFMDGFDHYGTAGDVVSLGKWGQIIGSLGLSIETVQTRVRTGLGSAKNYYGNDETVTKPLPASGGFVVGVAIYMTAQPQAYDWIRIKEGSVTHVSVAMTAGALVQVKCGATVLATGTTVLPLNAWTYVEFKGVIHDTAGSFEIRVDGVTEISGNNVDTRNGGTTGQWDRVSLSVPATAWNCYFDDFYVCDQSGSIRNDFLGPIRIETLMAQAGNGTNVGLTPSFGTDHGALVDEVPPNANDYNGSAVVGAKDTYNLPSVQLTGGILGVQVNLHAAKSDVGLRKICAVVRTGALDYDGGDKTLLTTYTYASEVWAQKPGGPPTDWTATDVNALEAGMKVTV